jgi:hypothetical protein
MSISITQWESYFRPNEFRHRVPESVFGLFKNTWNCFDMARQALQYDSIIYMSNSVDS